MMMDAAHQELAPVLTKMQILGHRICVNTIIIITTKSYHIISFLRYQHMHNLSLSLPLSLCLSVSVCLSLYVSLSSRYLSRLTQSPTHTSCRLPGGLADEDQKNDAYITQFVFFFVNVYLLINYLPERISDSIRGAASPAHDEHHSYCPSSGIT